MPKMPGSRNCLYETVPSLGTTRSKPEPTITSHRSGRANVLSRRPRCRGSERTRARRPRRPRPSRQPFAGPAGRFEEDIVKRRPAHVNSTPLVGERQRALQDPGRILDEDREPVSVAAARSRRARALVPSAARARQSRARTRARSCRGRARRFSASGSPRATSRPWLDDRNAVARVGLFEVVRRQEERRPCSARSRLRMLPDPPAAGRVEPQRRLVEEEDRRAVEDAARKVERAAHPARERAHAVATALLEAEKREGLADARRRSRGARGRRAARRTVGSPPRSGRGRASSPGTPPRSVAARRAAARPRRFRRSRAWPRDGRSSVVSIRIVVVLPAPFGPRNPKNSPGRTSRSIESTATVEP